jgi:two-component system phosphate regulon sensor histidine kinase PhoR
MSRVGRTSNALAALRRRLLALVRKTVEWLTVSRVRSRDAGRFEDVLHLLERDARLKAELHDELREATRLGEMAPVHGTSQIDFAELVRSATESLAVVAHERGVTLHVRCAATSVIISADAGELTHVVGHLLASAVASSTRASTIHSELSVSGDWTRLVIRASSSDALLAVLPPALESPSRHPRDLDAAAWEQLGLTTVRTLVARHGGIVRVENRDRQLIFTLSIPGDRRDPEHGSGKPGQ